MSQKPLPPSLAEVSFERRRAGYVEKMFDTHVHYLGTPGTLETLAKASEVNRIETMFVIYWGDYDPAKPQVAEPWLRDLDRMLPIGKRSVPFYKLDLQSNDPAQIDRAYDQGFWGLKWINNTIAYDDRFFDPLLKRAQEKKMPCLFHIGVLVGARGLGAGMSLMRADMLDTLAKRYPELLIQGAHLGCPNIDEALWGSEMNENLIWDCSGGCRFHCEANPLILHSATHRRARAWKSMTFGSDTTTGLYRADWADGWPSQIEHRMAEWQRIFAALPVPPTSEQLEDFFYGNAKRWMDRIVAGR